jgi:hypothetical protein
VEVVVKKEDVKVPLPCSKIFLLASAILLILRGAPSGEEKSPLREDPPTCPKCCAMIKPQPGMSADDLMKIKYYIKYMKFARDVSCENTRTMLIDKRGFTREKDAQRFCIILNRPSDDIDYKDLIILTAPQNVKGLSVLTWSHLNPKKDQDIWLWLPSLRKVRRISQAESDDAAFGSDWTQEELSSRRWDDETYTYVGEKKFEGFKSPYNGKIYYAGQDCYVVEAKPKRENWYYSKRIVWLHKDFAGRIFAEVYDPKGRKFKVFLYAYDKDWSDTKCIPNVYLECHNLITGHSTITDVGIFKFNTGLDENLFTEKALMRTKW